MYLFRPVFLLKFEKIEVLGPTIKLLFVLYANNRQLGRETYKKAFSLCKFSWDRNLTNVLLANSMSVFPCKCNTNFHSLEIFLRFHIVIKFSFWLVQKIFRVWPFAIEQQTKTNKVAASVVAQTNITNVTQAWQENHLRIENYKKFSSCLCLGFSTKISIFGAISNKMNKKTDFESSSR